MIANIIGAGILAIPIGVAIFAWTVIDYYEKVCSSSMKIILAILVWAIILIIIIK